MVSFKKTFLYINLLVILLVFFTASLKASEPYSLTADNIEYDCGGKKVYASGEAKFLFDGIEIQAEKLMIDTGKTLAVAEGKEVILKSSDIVISGTHLEYNYSRGTGKFYGANSKFENLNFRGQVIEITDGKDYKYSIKNAGFTDCILAEPHYQLKAEEIKIYPGEKIVGEKISFWWGKTKILQLPYYVMKYKEDGNLTNSVPFPEIGYDSGQGMIIELDYPYQINNSSDGNIYISTSQTGDKKVEIDNIYNLKKNLTLKTLYNYDKVIEDDENEDIQEIFSTILGYKITNNYQISSKFNYEKKIEDGNLEIDKYLTTGVNYEGNNLNIETFAGYNFSREKRQEELLVNYNLSKFSKADLSTRFFNETLDRYSARFNSLAPFKWEVIYREGYDIDYNPYFKVNLPEFVGVNTDLELGRVTEGTTTLNKVRADLNFVKSFEIFKDFTLNLRENYIINSYLSENQKYQALLSKITGSYSYKLSEKNNLKGEISWLKTITDGSFLLDEDEIEEEEIIKSELIFKVLTPQPQSAWIFSSSNSYNLPEEEWEDIKLGVERELDCYSLQMSYDFVDQTYEFSVNL